MTTTSTEKTTGWTPEKEAVITARLQGYAEANQKKKLEEGRIRLPYAWRTLPTAVRWIFGIPLVLLGIAVAIICFPVTIFLFFSPWIFEGTGLFEALGLVDDDKPHR
jgi:uncharacterized membrane protein